MVTKGFFNVKTVRVSRKLCLSLNLQMQSGKIGVILPPQSYAIKETVTLRNCLIISPANFSLYEIWAKYEIVAPQGIARPLFKHITKSTLSTSLELTLSNKMRMPVLVAKIHLAKSSLTRPEAVW